MRQAILLSLFLIVALGSCAQEPESRKRSQEKASVNESGNVAEKSENATQGSNQSSNPLGNTTTADDTGVDGGEDGGNSESSDDGGGSESAQEGGGTEGETGGGDKTDNPGGGETTGGGEEPKPEPVAPTASFSLILPASNNLTSISFPVVSEGAKSYRSKILIGGGECGLVSSFNPAVPLSELLTVTPGATNGTITKICVVAIGTNNVVQATPTFAEWTFQSSQVTLTAFSIPSGESSATTISPFIQGQPTSVKYKVATTDTCNNAAGYQNLSQSIDLSNLPNGDVFLCLIGTTANGEQTAARATKYKWKKVAALVATAGNATGDFEMKTLRIDDCGPTSTVSVKIDRIVGGNVVKTETKPCTVSVGQTLTFKEMCRADGNSCLKITFTRGTHTETSMPVPTSCLFQSQLNHNTLRLDVDTNGAGYIGTCKPNEDETFTLSCPASKKLNVTNCQ